MSTTDVIVVMGATGQQGGTVARHLLQQGHKVRAVTRTPAKAAALAQAGAEVVQGDMTDGKSLAAALQGAGGVFAMATPFEAGLEAEVRQGTVLADAAKAAGVSHYVYTSVQSANRQTGVPHFETKWKIEQHIQQLGLPATILRPSFFMENFASPWMWPAISQGKLAMPMKPETRLQMIALEDIGAFGAAAFTHPEKFLGQAVDLSGDELTMPDVAAMLTRVLGTPVTFEFFPLDQVEAAMGHDFFMMYKWFNDVGYNVDIPGLTRRHGIPLTSFEQAVRTIQWPKAA